MNNEASLYCICRPEIITSKSKNCPQMFNPAVVFLASSSTGGRRAPAFLIMAAYQSSCRLYKQVGGKLFRQSTLWEVLPSPSKKNKNKSGCSPSHSVMMPQWNKSIYIDQSCSFLQRKCVQKDCVTLWNKSQLQWHAKALRKWIQTTKCIYHYQCFNELKLLFWPPTLISLHGQSIARVACSPQA